MPDPQTQQEQSGTGAGAGEEPALQSIRIVLADDHAVVRSVRSSLTWGMATF